MVVIALTGAFGSGKSQVSSFWQREGIRIIDADVIGHQLLACEPFIQSSLSKHFGPEILAADGTVDRTVLAKRAFCDDSSTALLNSVMHPAILMQMSEELAKAIKDGIRLAVIEVPLLFEAGFAGLADAVVTVVAKETLIIDRLREQGWDMDQIDQRLARQWTQADKAALADYVIDNSGTLEDLRREAELVMKSICERFGLD